MDNRKLKIILYKTTNLWTGCNPDWRIAGIFDTQEQVDESMNALAKGTTYSFKIETALMFQPSADSL